MDRRQFITGMGAISMTLIAGCSSGDDGDSAVTPTAEATPTTTPTPTETSTPTQTPTPQPEFEADIEVPRSISIEEPFTATIVVENTGGAGGTFSSTYSVRADGGSWHTADAEIELYVPANSTERYSGDETTISEPGTYQIRVDETGSITTFEVTSRFQGPAEEDRTYVDLQYRDYSESEVTQIKSNAQNLPYENVYRNAEELQGEPVHFTGTINQVIPYETHNVYFVSTNNSYENVMYVSYVGDRFIEGDQVDLWGEVLGIEIYETGAGSTNTVPAIAVADMQRQSQSTSTQ